MHENNSNVNTLSIECIQEIIVLMLCYSLTHGAELPPHVYQADTKYSATSGWTSPPSRKKAIIIWYYWPAHLQKWLKLWKK